MTLTECMALALGPTLLVVAIAGLRRLPRRSGPALRYLDHAIINAPKQGTAELTKEWGEAMNPWITYARWPSVTARPPGECPLGWPEERVALVDVARGGVFRVVRESWLVRAEHSTRESDGARADPELHKRLRGVLEVAEARAKQLEDLTNVA